MTVPSPDRAALRPLGWDSDFEAALGAMPAADLVVARVFGERRGVFGVADGARQQQARIAGRLRHHATTAADLPVVGDWVVYRPIAEGAAAAGEQATIHAVLPRRTRIARKVAGDRPDEQILAANVDTVLILMGLDGDLNARRLDRYVTLARAGGARPFVLLTKADLVTGDDPRVAELGARFAGVPIAEARLLDEGDLPSLLRDELRPGRTLVLVGSSGAGKSTLVNRLVGRAVQRTAAVRGSDSRGRHTTTYRQMFVVQGGALVIDTPGLREIQLADADAGNPDAFPEIAALAAGCRFRDCHHDRQPGCAVADAVARGELGAARLAAFHRLADGPGAPAPAGRRRRRGTRG